MNVHQRKRFKSKLALWQVLVVFSVTLLLWRTFQWYRPKDLDGLVKTGLTAIEQKKFDEAQVALDILLGTAPDSAQASLLSGALLNQKGKQYDAIVAFERAKESPATAATAALLLGKAHFQQQHFSLAAIELKNAVKSDPNNVETLRLLAESFDAVGASAQAIEIANTLANLPDPDPDLIYLAGKLHLNNGSFRRAAELLRQCSSIVGDGKLRVPVLEDLAAAQLESGELTELESTLRLTPINNIKMLIINARYQHQRGNSQATIDSLQQALELDPNNWAVKTLLESCKTPVDSATSLKLPPNRSESSLVKLNEARSRAAEELANPELRFQVGLAEEELGMKEQAIRSFKETVSLNHSHLQAHEHLARLNKTAGNDDR